MSFTIQRATRKGVRPLICLYAESGCGKTMSGLLLARGFVGPSGKIGMIDSESGRGSLYADVIPGGYDVLDLAEPFSPARYIEAITAIEQSGATIGVLDSGSHEWEGIGGVLDMAAENEQRSGKSGLHNWKTPKFEHAKFILKLLKSTLPWVICLRAKFKTRQGKDEKGKTCIVKDDHVSPIQAEEFIFETTAHAEILPNHAIRLTKCSHPALRECFPQTGPITSEHGAAIARWCAAPEISPHALTGTRTGKPPEGQPTSGASTGKVKARMFELLKPYGEQLLKTFAEQRGWLAPNETLEQWPDSRVPQNKDELRKLMADIETFRDSGV